MNNSKQNQSIPNSIDGNKPDGDKPDDNKPDDDKPDGDKPNDDKPNGDKPNGDKPDSDNPPRTAEYVRKRTYEKPKEIPIRTCFGESSRAKDLWEFTVGFLREKNASGVLPLETPNNIIVSPIPELGYACASLYNCSVILVKGDEKNTNFRGDGLGTGTIGPSLSHRESAAHLAYWCENIGGLKKLKALDLKSQNLAIVRNALHDHAPLVDLTRLTGEFITAVFEKFYGEKTSVPRANRDLNPDISFVREKQHRDADKKMKLWHDLVRGVPNPLAQFRQVEKLDPKFETYVLAEEEDFPRESACLFVAAIFPNCGPEIFLELTEMLARFTPSRFLPEDQPKPPTQITDRVLKNCNIQFKTQENEVGAREPGPFLQREGMDQRDVHQLAENFIGEAPLLTGRYLQTLASYGMLGHWNDNVARDFARFSADFQRRLSRAPGGVAFPPGFAEQTLMPIIFGPMLARNSSLSQAVFQSDQRPLLSQTIKPERLNDLLGELVEKGLDVRPMTRHASMLSPDAIDQARYSPHFSDQWIGRLFWSMLLTYDQVRITDFVPFVRDEKRETESNLTENKESQRREAAAWPYEYRLAGLEEAARDGRLRRLILTLGLDWDDLSEENDLRSLLTFQLFLILLEVNLGADNFEWLAFAAGLSDEKEDDELGLTAIAQALYSTEFEQFVDIGKPTKIYKIEGYLERIALYRTISGMVDLIVIVGLDVVIERDEIWKKWRAHSLPSGRAMRLFSLMAISASMDDDGELCFHVPKVMRKWLAMKDQDAVPYGKLVTDDLKHVQRKLDLVPKLLGEMHKEKNFDRETIERIQLRRSSMKEALRSFNHALRDRKPKPAESREIEKELED